MADTEVTVQGIAQELYSMGWSVKRRHNSQSTPDYKLLYWGQVIHETDYAHRVEILEKTGINYASDELIDVLCAIRTTAFIAGDDGDRNKKMNDFLAKVESILDLKPRTRFEDKLYQLDPQRRIVIVLMSRFPGIGHDHERMHNIEVRVKGLAEPPWKVEWK